MLVMDSKLKNKYFVGSLPGSVREADVWRHFSRFGSVIDIEIIRNRTTNFCKGFGFLRIDLHIPEQEFIRADHTYTASRRLTVQKHLEGGELRQKREEFDSKRLFLTGIMPWVREEDLYAYFSQYGEVALAFTASNKTSGREQILGCVHFHDASLLDQVIEDSPHVFSGSKVKCSRFIGKRFNNKSERQYQHERRIESYKQPSIGLKSLITENVDSQHFDNFWKKLPFISEGEAFSPVFQEEKKSSKSIIRMAPLLKINHLDQSNVRFNILDKPSSASS